MNEYTVVIFIMIIFGALAALASLADYIDGK
jgi:hypothetical protein